MHSFTERIREVARRLLAENQVDVVIGYQQGNMPMMSQPVLLSSAGEAERLHWDSYCSANLANYLPKRQDRVAVVAKGCDSRNIVIQILENQIKREQLYIIGVPCGGMIDRRRVLAALDAREVLEVRETAGQLLVRGRGFEETLKRDACLQESCAICTQRNPVIFDEMIAEPVAEQTGVDRYADVRALEGMSAEERWQHFQEELAPCIRCYACRNACPMCYCPTCFVDESMPQWLGKSIDPADTMTFHFLRAFHLAGRCTDCGSCEQACPLGIRVRQLTKKLEKDIKELYGYETGLTLEERPPLDTYRTDDPQEFIR